MNKKYNALVISIGALFMVAGWIMQYQKGLNTLGEVCSRLGSLVCLVILISHNGLVKTVYWPIMVAFVLLPAFLGLMALIILPRYAGPLIIMISSPGVLVCYTLRFLKKTDRYHLDYLKWIWVLTWFLANICYILQDLYAGDILYIVANSLFLIILVDYVLFDRREGLLIRQEKAGIPGNE